MNDSTFMAASLVGYAFVDLILVAKYLQCEVPLQQDSLGCWCL